MLYVSKISINLLSIIALDRRGFFITFKGKRVKIVNRATNAIVARGHVVDSLYELVDSNSDRAFSSLNVSNVYIISKITKEAYIKASK